MATREYHGQAAAETLDLIRRGGDPWLAIGQFVDDWHRTPSPNARRWSRQRPGPPRATTFDGQPSWPPRSNGCAPKTAWTTQNGRPTPPIGSASRGSFTLAGGCAPGSS